VQRQDFCVYNQSNECFLSLRATQGDRPLARLKQWLGMSAHRVDEGCWIHPRNERRAISFFNARDIVYLDENHRVLHVLESLRALRVLPLRNDAASLLALPVHTISSSKTRAGNQLLICAASEMEMRLKILTQGEPEQKLPEAQITARAVAPLPGESARRRVPAQVAYFAEGGKLAIHPIRDLSPFGLFLVTRDRWPVGSEVNMSLQPTGGIEDRNAGPVTVRMRVTGWGSDGVGLEFVGAGMETAERTPVHIC